MLLQLYHSLFKLLRDNHTMRVALVGNTPAAKSVFAVQISDMWSLPGLSH
jgi:hypothetical protein